MYCKIMKRNAVCHIAPLTQDMVVFSVCSVVCFTSTPCRGFEENRQEMVVSSYRYSLLGQSENLPDVGLLTLKVIFLAHV